MSGGTTETIDRAAADPATAGNRGRILLVEDQAVVRESLARLLRMEGYEVTCAANGLEALVAAEAMAALASARSGQRPADLVLLDVMLPKMSGVQFLEELLRERQNAWAGVPVVLLTGAMDTKQITRARELGARDVMVKARFAVDDLLRRVGRHVRGEGPHGSM